MYEQNHFIPALVVALVALAIPAIAMARRLKQRSNVKTSWSAVAIGFATVLAVLLASAWAQAALLDLQYEDLHSGLMVAAAVGGLLAGVVMAWRAQSLALFESTLVAALILCAGALITSRPDNGLFAFATVAAYVAALMGAAYLALLLGLFVGAGIGYLLLGEGKFQPSFSFESLMGTRFLFARRGGHAVSMITWVSIVAVGFGCMGMVLVTSIMNGFGADIRSKIVGSNAHVIVMKYAPEFDDYQDVMAKVQKMRGVEGVSPFVMNEVMISSDVNLTGAVIKGIDVASAGAVTKLPSQIVDGKLEWLDDAKSIAAPTRSNKNPGKGKSPIDALDEQLAANDEPVNSALLPGIVIGQEMARNLKVFVGDVINVVSPVGELGPTGPVPKARAYRVAAVFYSGMYEYDSKFVYVQLADAQHFFGLKKGVTGVEIRTNNLDQASADARTIQRGIGGYPYYTKDWMQMNRNLFQALRLEKVAMFLILAVIVMMASLLILVALVLVVIEKSREIAILKSMGATDASVMKIFVTYGVLIGGVGTAGGIAVGLALCGLIATFGIGLDAEVYYISELPVNVETGEVVLVALSSLVMSFLATIPPALFAARLRPVEGLRQ